MIWSCWCCQRQKVIRYCSIWRKQNVDQIWSTKYRSIQGIHHLFICLRSGQIFCRNGNFKIWPWEIMTMVRGKVNAKVIYETNHPIYTIFVSCKSDHAFLGHRQFIIWPWNFEVKVNAEFKEQNSINFVAISMVIVAKTDSKYGLDTCIVIYFF